MKIWKLLLASVLCLGVGLVGCDLEDEELEDVDSGPIAEEDAGFEVEDTGPEPTVYRYVRICAVETEEEWADRSRANLTTAGPDIDAVEIRRGTELLGYASSAPESLQNVREGSNYSNPEAAVGAPDVVNTDHANHTGWVSIGWRGNYLTLMFDFDIEPDDRILVWELGGEISGLGHDRADDPVKVQVAFSTDGVGWVNAGQGGLYGDANRHSTGDHGYIEFDAPQDTGAYVQSCF